MMNAPPQSPRSLKNRAQRDRILDAARSLFANRGFDAVTMGDVAEQAGVVRATVFNQFGSKAGLVEAITEGVLDGWAGMLENALAEEATSTPTLVRALFDHMGLGIEQFHAFYRGVFREIMKIQVGLEEGGVAVAADARARARLERLIARGQLRGELSPAFATTDLVSTFMSLANGTITHWLYEDAAGSLRERMRSAAEIWLGAVATGEPCHEPLPDLFGAIELIAPVTPISRAHSRRKP